MELHSAFVLKHSKPNNDSPTHTHGSLTLHKKSVRACGAKLQFYEWQPSQENTGLVLCSSSWPLMEKQTILLPLKGNISNRYVFHSMKLNEIKHFKYRINETLNESMVLLLLLLLSIFKVHGFQCGRIRIHCHEKLFNISQRSTK